LAHQVVPKISTSPIDDKSPPPVLLLFSRNILFPPCVKP
jgi:hypothetical protein